MTSAHRSRLARRRGCRCTGALVLGWTAGTRRCDALLLVFARDEAALAESLTRHRMAAPSTALREVALLDTEDIGRGEHFGFRDGLSQPTM